MSDLRGMRGLITGATGFVGGVLAARLRERGCDVHTIVRATSHATRARALSDLGCELHSHDGSPQGLRAIVAGARPDCTWHLATKFVPEHAPGDVTPLIRSNVEFGSELLEALAAAGPGAVVTAGTAWQQHGNAAYSPMSLYAATKEAFDAIAEYYAEVRRLRIVECLMFDTYGPRDPRKKLLWALGEAARTGVPLKLSGDGRQYIDFLHVNDVVAALLVAGERAINSAPGTTERWAVRSAERLTVRELVDRYARVRGTAVPVEWNARPPRAREMFVPWTAGDLLPGWSPRTPLDEGLAQLG